MTDRSGVTETSETSETLDELLTFRASKWTPVVMLRLRSSTFRFSELQREIGGISQKALTATLRALERDGFVTRTSYATIPPRVDYELTELGRELLVVLEAFESFRANHWHKVVIARRQFAEQAGRADLEVLRINSR